MEEKILDERKKGKAIIDTTKSGPLDNDEKKELHALLARQYCNAHSPDTFRTVAVEALLKGLEKELDA